MTGIESALTYSSRLVDPQPARRWQVAGYTHREYVPPMGLLIQVVGPG